MQFRRGWQRCGYVVVSVCLVSWAGFFAGCQKVGDGGGETAEESPPPTTPPPPPAGPVVSITLTAGTTSLQADGVSSTTITAQLVTSTNAPAPDGTEVSFSTDLGRFDTSGAKSIVASVSQGSGMVNVPFISEAGVAGTATVVAQVQNLTQSLQITLIPPPPPPGPVVGLTLEAEQTVLPADGASSTTITASVRSTTGSPVPDGTVVTFTTDLGRFSTEGDKSMSAATTQGTGEAVVPFISEPGVVGTATVVASVGTLTQSVQIVFEGPTSPAPSLPSPPGRVIGINLSADDEDLTLLADGSSSTTIRAFLQTSNGAPAPDGTVVTFTTDLGRFTTTDLKTLRAVTKEGTGTAVVPLISEPNVIGTATVVANVAGLTQSLQISFVLTTPPTPPPTDIAGITLSALNESLVANGVSSTAITALLITSTGVPVPDGVLVTFTTDLGRFTSGGAKLASARTGQGSGTAIVPFISEPDVVGTATIVASAGAVTQSIEVEFLPATPLPPPPGTIVGIRLTAEPNTLVANGTSSAVITAELITFTGNAAPDGVTVTFITDKGRFSTDNAKTASATTSGGTGKVLVPFISEAGVVGTATVIATVNGITQSVQIALTGAGDPAQIILTADVTVIPLSGTTVLTAEVLDGDGNNVANGTAVNFATNLSGTGVTPVATTTDGVATATFSAGTSAGVATVTATSGSASASLSITIQAGAAGSLEFVSADPTLIGVRGSALPQTSTITFRVRDVNGNPVADGTPVTFTLISGLGGGEMVAPTVVGTIAGLASTVLTSGTVSGSVRVLASVTVGTTTLTSSSANVSITGGLPSGAHIGVAPAFLNIAGLVTQGVICPITAIVGDRFGNPVPENTTVSFLTNGGVVGAQGLTDRLGNASSEIKTGAPIPRVGPNPDPAPSDPRTGFVTVIAVTQGEETFIDSNGNGIFDGPGEFDPTDPEIDTPEPFIDQISLCNGGSFPAPCVANPVAPPLVSGDGLFDPNNRFELFIDGNGNGVWDPPNTIWDANKPIFASTRVLFTGPTQLTVGVLQGDGSCSGNPGGFAVPDGGSSEVFCFLVSDPAGRPLVSGTTIEVTTSAGAISGSSNVVLPDIQRGGPGITFFTFAVVDDDPGDTDPASEALVTVKVVSPIGATCPGGNGDATVSFSGTVN